MPRIAGIGVLALVCSAGFSATQGGGGAGRGQARPGPNAIVGRVTDAAGAPVADVFVTALRPLTSGDRPFVPLSVQLRDVTNAAGEYQLNGVPFEPLVVVALPHNKVLLDASGLPNRVGFGNTFYPNATEFSDAKTVTPTPSGPARADVTLVPARLSLITGTVTRSDGSPAPGGQIGVTHGDGLFGLDSRAVRILEGGRFGAPGLAPGTYYLIFHESEFPPPRGVTPLISEAKVVVSTTDVSGVRVLPVHMVTVSGRAIVDPALRDGLDSTPIQIGATPVDFDGNPGPTQPGEVRSGLTFSFKNWPGAVRVRVFPEATWQIKAMRLNDVDVTGRPLVLVQGKDVSGLEVEIVRR